jgi:hypothetical protein
MVEARSPLPRSMSLTAPTRSSVLHHLPSIGGIGLVMARPDAFGLSIASAQTAPPALTGSGTGKRVAIRGSHADPVPEALVTETRRDDAMPNAERSLRAH